MRKLQFPLGLLLWYHGLWQRQVWYQRKSEARLRLARASKLASDGTRPSLLQLMLGSLPLPTKHLRVRTLFVAL